MERFRVSVWYLLFTKIVRALYESWKKVKTYCYCLKMNQRKYLQNKELIDHTNFNSLIILNN